MKKMIFALTVAASIATFSAQANAEEHNITLENGQQVTLTVDYCVDPVTKHIGPCLFEVTPQAAQDNDACWDPVNKRYEPCL